MPFRVGESGAVASPPRAGARADYAGDAFALCAGAWSGALCPPPPPRIEPARGFLLGLRTTTKIDFSPSPTVVLQGGRYVFARRGGDGEMRFAVGGGFARAGFSTARADDEIESLAAAAAQMIPSLRGARIEWTRRGFRPLSASSESPLVARHPRLANLFLHCGHFRYGLTMAPATAAALAQIVAAAGLLTARAPAACE